MITKSNLEPMLQFLGFSQKTNKIYEKNYSDISCSIVVDFNSEKILYPEVKGFKVNMRATCNFSDPENFVVLECVNRLFEKGYRPEHIELEKQWTLGHDAKGGRADICVTDEDEKMLFIVECKTYDTEYKKELKNIISNGGQLVSYWQQERSCKWLVLYASNFDGSNVIYTTKSIDCSDDANILATAKNDESILLYKNAHTVEELYSVWNETYEKRFYGDVIFRDDSVAYKIGVKPLRKKDLKDFSENDKIVNRFEEILRHNNVSDKENAFNRLIALFICKLVDEIQKADNDIVEFQYKSGTDTYESLQDRLQRLHKEGMEKFMREKIFYVSDDYAENLVKQYTGQRRVKMIEDLRETLRILKFYTNNDFAFKDVHNEELFYQNGKILVEVVQLFQDYRIIGSADIQMLGDLFEQLLNKGFKQNEGQFFTPIPITRFIWDSLPLELIMVTETGTEYPKVIDYACGAGHFLTQGFEAIQAYTNSIKGSQDNSNHWVENKIYGIEKDYRLARVSKISLFMHGAGDGNIIFGDGLEDYPDKNITSKSFDVLVANPPYSLKAFKPHLKLNNNSLEILDKISNDGSEIETLFVERISQLLKPTGVAAVILPSSILNKENESFINAREILLKNFNFKAIATMGSKTFGATGTNTIILFLQKFDEPPKRYDLICDSVDAILNCENIIEWEDAAILRGYLKKIAVSRDDYYLFVNKSKAYFDWKDNKYFGGYYQSFINSTEYKNKTNQKLFGKLSDAEKTELINKRFYEYSLSIEKEKLRFYSLVYNQNTLIVSAPDENKEQEKFLGYKWSNRKGQEGIQIVKAGGCLYNDTDRFDNNTLAGLIRNTFLETEEYDVDELSDCYYTLRLQDMIDFSNVSFNKSIKTTPIRILKDIPGITNYRLNDKSVFDLSIGDRVLSDEVVPNGSIPIYSSNVFEEFGRIDKQNITDFSVPSIIWGIDGDWMVNVIPENQPFYPTDHCGVLRVKNEDIVPKYLALALQVEGEFERFSRSNRPSIKRIANLIIQIPSLEEQQCIVDKIDAIDAKIEKEKAIISEQTDKVKSKFVEMFGDINDSDSCEKIPLLQFAELKDDLRKPVSEIDRLSMQTGVLYSYYGANGKIGTINSFLTDFDMLCIAEDCGLYDSKEETAYIVRGKAWVNNHAHIIKPKNEAELQYLYYYLYFLDFNEYIKDGLGRNKLTQGNLQNINIVIPQSDDLKIFSDFASDCDKLKFDAFSKMIKYRFSIRGE